MHWIDPDSLKPLKSKVERFLFNTKGDADGMLLANGFEAHFPPHLSNRVLKAVKSGDVVTLFGVKPRAVDMIACVAIESVTGQRIDDPGPPAKNHRDVRKLAAERVDIEDTAVQLLHGPKGEVRGVLLARGSIVRFPPHAAASVARLLRPGKVIAVRGDARSVLGATVIEAKAFGKSRTTLKPIAPKPHE